MAATNSAINTSSTVVLRGTYASMPAASAGTTVYHVTDPKPIGEWISDGSAWHPVIMGVECVKPKSAASFTAVNSPTSLTDLNGALNFISPSDGASNVFRGYVESLSATTAYVECATAINRPYTIPSITAVAAGPCMRESATGKLYTLFYVYNWSSVSGALVYSNLGVWTSSTAKATSVDVSIVGAPNAPCIIRLRRDSTNMYAEMSMDRNVWYTYDTRTITSVFTTAPDQVGFGANGISGIVDVNIPHYMSGS